MEHKLMTLEKNIYKNSQKKLSCKDYLVSKEQFDLFYNTDYNILHTSPVPENIEHYYESEDYISHSENQRSFADVLYNIVREYSLGKKEKLIRSFGSERKLLDVGCGVGSFLKKSSDKGWEVVGTEPNMKAREVAIKEGLNVFDKLQNVEDDNFSVITLWHVLEHIPNLSETIITLKEKLSKDGRLVVAVPNFESWDANHYDEFWAAYDAPRHIWHFSKKSISKIFKEFDMEVENILPMKFDSFYVSLLSEKNKTGRRNFLRAFYNGLKSNMKAKKEMNYSSLIYVLKPI